MKWRNDMREITTLEEFDAILAESEREPVLIFKHSTRCPVSAAAHNRMQAWERVLGETAPPVYFVKVIESRDLSNEIAAHLGVAHQSPQVILVRDGFALWNASHGGVGGLALDAALHELGGRP
jgi:bacillithiol system protein YtxJ